MRVYSTKQVTTKSHQAALIPDLEPILGTIRPHSANQRAIYWDIEDAVRSVPWLRSSISTIGRNLVGPTWYFVKDKDNEKDATPKNLDILKKFYGIGATKKYTNIKDFYEPSSKIYATAVKLAMGNSCAWEIRKDQLFGQPASYDVIPGYVEPQYDKNGDLANPAFRQYLSISGLSYVTWDDPNDIVFFARPDFGGLAFASDLEALTRYTLPADIYAALSWLSMHKNRNAPLDGIWIADPTMSDDDYDELQKFLAGRYGGAQNYGKNPILARGGVDFKRIQRAPDELPYEKGRDWARQEIAGITGVPGSKLGVTSEMSRASSREAKRDYYETVMEPLQQWIDEVTYQQVHIRLFGIYGWRIHFGNPMFVNEVEQASIDRTYWNIGARNSNEIRVRDGKEPRKGGDDFFEPTNMVPRLGQNLPGTEVPGRPEPAKPEPSQPEPIPPSESHPTGQKPRPVRSDEQSISEELRKWREFHVKRIQAGKTPRPFVSEIIEDDLYQRVSTALAIAGNDVELVKDVFKLALERIQDERSAKEVAVPQPTV